MYEQEKLIAAFIKYIDYQRSQNGLPPLQDLDKKRMSQGLCYGLSIVVSEMNTQGNRERKWWLNLIKHIMDAEKDLNDPAFLEKLATDWGSTTSETHAVLMEQAINYVYFSHAVSDHINVLMDTGCDLLLKSVSNQITVDDPSFLEGLSQNEPTLIQQGEKYYIYGKPDGNTWKLTPLPNLLHNKLEENFNLTFLEEAHPLPYDSKYRGLYSAIEEGHDYGGFKKASYSQSSFLEKTDSKFIQLESVQNGKIKKNESSEKIKGCLNNAMLEEFLDQTVIEKNICLVSNKEHACAVLYDDELKKYGFYDPNYGTGEPNWFNDKKSLNKEIVTRLDHESSEIEIELISHDKDFEPECFKAFKEFSEAQQKYLLSKSCRRLINEEWISWEDLKNKLKNISDNTLLEKLSDPLSQLSKDPQSVLFCLKNPEFMKNREESNLDVNESDKISDNNSNNSSMPNINISIGGFDEPKKGKTEKMLFDSLEEECKNINPILIKTSTIDNLAEQYNNDLARLQSLRNRLGRAEQYSSLDRYTSIQELAQEKQKGLGICLEKKCREELSKIQPDPITESQTRQKAKDRYTENCSTLDDLKTQVKNINLPEHQKQSFYNMIESKANNLLNNYTAKENDFNEKQKKEQNGEGIHIVGPGQ